MARLRVEDVPLVIVLQIPSKGRRKLRLMEGDEASCIGKKTSKGYGYLSEKVSVLCR